MGYLVTIKYHPKSKDSSFGFDTENSLEKTMRVGKKEEEIDEENLALVILKQLSRRDILVHDVEIIQFVKKKIKVRESTNGIVVGNKKYTFDNTTNGKLNVEVEDSEFPKQQPVVQKNIQPNTPAPVVNRNIQIIKEEYFEPDPVFDSRRNQFKQMGLTIGEKYKIVKQIGTDKYRVINDSGGTIDVPVQHFSAVSTMRNELSRPSQDIQLRYPGEVNTAMINIR